MLYDRPKTVTTVRHWLPIVTFCPVNNLPDIVYVSVSFDTFEELYAVRRKVRQLASWKKMFMEDIAKCVADEFPHACEVTVRLAFNRHIVTISKE